MADQGLQYELVQVLDPNIGEEDARRRIVQFCEIDLTQMEDTLAKHAALVSYVVACFETAKVNEAIAKHKVEETEARAFVRLMSTLKDPVTNKTPSATELNVRLKIEDDVLEKVNAQHTAMRITARLKALAEGMQHRKDMLVQIASKQRQELYSDRG